jgi:hypothetical protein
MFLGKMDAFDLDAAIGTPQIHQAGEPLAAGRQANPKTRPASNARGINARIGPLR